MIPVVIFSHSFLCDLLIFFLLVYPLTVKGNPNGNNIYIKYLFLFVHCCSSRLFRVCSFVCWNWYLNFLDFAILSFDSSVGRAEDCRVCKVILRSLVRIRLEGNFFLHSLLDSAIFSLLFFFFFIVRVQ